MSYAQEWRILGARIRGFIEAAELYARFLAVGGGDPYRMHERLRQQAETVLEAIQAFGERHRQTLPPQARPSIDHFLEHNRQLVRDADGNAGLREARVKTVLIALAAFETELTFLLSDPQEGMRTRSEMAFTHLRRSIVADETIREKWERAFRGGEVACEKLGAAHLLAHGIWAFKANAEGARTDLVYQEPLEDDAVYRSGAGLVLTEWKRTEDTRRVERLFTEAREQAQRYARGALAGIELTRYRFAVVVSGEQAPTPADVEIDGVVYRHVLVPVNPRVPSRT